MNFWGNLLEHFKSRSAWLFMPALLVFFAIILLPQFLSALFSEIDFPNFDLEKILRVLFWVMPVVVVLVVAGIAKMIRRSRARRKKRYEISPLSRDEIRKARSKLVIRK
jgi:nucleoside recognition membrane protein YjiH